MLRILYVKGLLIVHSRLHILCPMLTSEKSEKNILSNFEGCPFQQVREHSTTHGKLEGMKCVFYDINLVFKLGLGFRPILSAFRSFF